MNSLIAAAAYLIAAPLIVHGWRKNPTPEQDVKQLDMQLAEMDRKLVLAKRRPTHKEIREYEDLLKEYDRIRLTLASLPPETEHHRSRKYNPARSERQRRLFGMALAYKRGQTRNASRKVKELAKRLSERTLRDYAKG